jgi:hypothetical protein
MRSAPASPIGAIGTNATRVPSRGAAGEPFSGCGPATAACPTFVGSGATPRAPGSTRGSGRRSPAPDPRRARAPPRRSAGMRRAASSDTLVPSPRLVRLHAVHDRLYAGSRLHGQRPTRLQVSRHSRTAVSKRPPAPAPVPPCLIPASRYARMVACGGRQMVACHVDARAPARDHHQR